MLQNDSTPQSKILFKTAHVTEHTILASTFHFFRLSTTEPFKFLPGQYLSVRVADTRINCYSIAGQSGDYSFDLLVNVAPGGLGSQFFERLSVGEEVTFLGPLGKFGLHLKDGSESMIFGATGSGIAPLICMIMNLLYVEKITKPINLYLGLNSIDEVFWQNKLFNLSLDYPNFKSSIVIRNSDPRWKGDVGFITQHIKHDFNDAHAVSGYLCGHPQMIADVSEMLIANGCNPARIYTERY